MELPVTEQVHGAGPILDHDRLVKEMRITAPLTYDLDAVGPPGQPRRHGEARLAGERQAVEAGQRADTPGDGEFLQHHRPRVALWCHIARQLMRNAQRGTISLGDM